VVGIGGPVAPRLVPADVRVDAVDVAKVEARTDAPRQRLADALDVPDPLTERDHLLGDLEPLARPARRPQRPHPRRQRRGLGLVVARLARQPQRLGAQIVRARPALGPEVRLRETRHEHRPHRAQRGVGREHRERAFELRDGLVVGLAEAPCAHSGEPERRFGAAHRVADPLRGLGGRPPRLTATGTVARAGAGVAEAEQQPNALVVVGVAERPQRGLEERRSLLVGQRGDAVAGGALGPLDRALAVASHERVAGDDAGIVG
jgi:hypothetical protein